MDSIRTEIKQHRGSAVSRFFHAKVDKDKITGWNRDLARILQIFNVRSVNSVRHPLSDPLSD